MSVGAILTTNYKDDYFYTIRKRRKKNNKIRVIHAPSPKLKKLQKEFSEWFFKVKSKDFKYANHLMGFMPGKSIADNARPHLGKDWVLNLDIKDFFPTINDKIGKLILEDLPRSKNPLYWFTSNKPTGFKRMKEHELLKTLFMTENGIDYKLPQGSPASPILANYVGLQIIDPIVFRVINKFQKELGLSNVDYTRYADDLTISFNYKDSIEGRKKGLELFKKIKKQIESTTPFKIKEDKTMIKHKSQRQSVTGVVVNGKETKINRKLMNNMRAAIYNAKRNNKTLDKETQGMLSFIQSVNKAQYNKLMQQLGDQNASNRS